MDQRRRQGMNSVPRTPPFLCQPLIFIRDIHTKISHPPMSREQAPQGQSWSAMGAPSFPCLPLPTKNRRHLVKGAAFKIWCGLLFQGIPDFRQEQHLCRGSHWLQRIRFFHPRHQQVKRLYDHKENHRCRDQKRNDRIDH